MKATLQEVDCQALFLSFIDKYIVEKEVKDYRGMPIYYTAVGLLAGVAFWVFMGHVAQD